MISFSPDQLDRLIDGFVTANTAPSFQQWLEKQLVVRKLVEDESMDAILETLSKLAARKKKTFVIEATAYALLVAYIAKCRLKGLRVNLSFDISEFRWAEKMIRDSARTLVSTSQYQVNKPLPESSILVSSMPAAAASSLVNLSGVAYDQIIEE